MKKIFYFISFLILILQSCTSSEDINDSNSTSVLIKKKIETTPDGTFTSIYSYTNDKLIKISLNNGVRVANYFYSGDLIERVEVKDNNNNLISKMTYNYNSNNQIISYIELNYINNTGDRGVFTYNSNGTISCIEYEGDLTLQNNQTLTKVISLDNGEVSSLSINYSSSTETTNFTYDNKNSPYKNILGINKVSYALIGRFTSDINHNILQYTTSGNGYSYQYDYQYTYNSGEYPTTRTETSGGNSDSYIEYFY